MTLCGHSSGGATVIEVMRRENPFAIATVLDPWVEPVRDPAKEEDEVKGRIAKPIYVLNSESFTVWEEHFEKLKRICLDARKVSGRGWLLTLTGSKHTDFSDYPFLLPRIFRSTVEPRQTIEVFSTATYKQMGLSRQRCREQEDTPGYKVDSQRSFRDASSACLLGTSQTANLLHIASHDGLDHAASPTLLKRGVMPFPTGVRGLKKRGNVPSSETMVSSVVRDVDQGGNKHKALEIRVKAEQEPAKVASKVGHPENKLQRPQVSDSDRGRDSHQNLRKEGKQDMAEVGPEARDMVGSRHGQTSLNTTSRDNSMFDKGFITDIRYLKMIDADQDVQRVHEQLEQVAERLKDKSKWTLLTWRVCSTCGVQSPFAGAYRKVYRGETCGAGRLSGRT